MTPKDARPPAYSRSRWLWLGYWLALFVVMHIPIQPHGMPRVAHLDKVVHFVMYFVLAWLGGRYFLASGRVSNALILLWASACIAYAALDEWLQQFVGRETSLADWTADVVGVVAAGVVIALTRRRMSRTVRPAGMRESR